MERQKFKDDWAGLPPELVTIISEKVTTITAYIRLRLVCKAWRQALPPNPRHHPPQSPWLLLPRIPTDGDTECSSDHSDELNFYDPFQSKTHRLRFPYISGKRICGFSHGWLVLEHDLRVSLFNPITQSVMDFPSFDTLLKYPIPSRPLHPANRQFVGKAILSCNPSDDGCLVVSRLRMTSNWQLAFCRIGDTHWTGLLRSDPWIELIDLFCHKNMVYMVYRVIENKVSVYNLQDLSVTTFPSIISYNAAYDQISLVDGDSESVHPLVIISFQGYKENKKNISIYKWFEDRQQWCRVRNIGKSTLFLSWGHSINLQLEEGHENQIYYDVRLNTDDEQQFCIGIRRVYLERKVDLRYNPGPIEYYPSRSGIPMWVTPSLF
ncbi:hypothetical protein LUZ61_003251 [Rhynchospora tenuis]|uniref:F-box domain-containing protein n=1 Tax=Rhynchospora tenuis TaxID=198213 RepID=A0AAD5ZKM6_9POAL|nr:hypothetical protein LUZ61_003251 [Rhynchospora tenuis]